MVQESDVAQSMSSVVGIPVTVHAGQETIWILKISNALELEDNHTCMELFLRAVSKEERVYDS